MSKKDSKIKQAKEKLQHDLPLLLSDSLSITSFLSQDHVLQQRYTYDLKTHSFACKEGKKFIDFVAYDPERQFYELLNSPDPDTSLAHMLSESDLVKCYLIYCWAFDYAHQHKLGKEWQTGFIADMHSYICEKNKQNLQLLISSQQSKWSKTKSKLYADIFKRIEYISSAEQKGRYYFQMLEQIEQKHFYHNDSEHHVFSKFSEQVSRYEYETLTQELNEALQPILYYPQTDQQQANICNFAKHCLFVDKDTQELKYINSNGTLFTLTQNLLITKQVEHIKEIKGQCHLEYKKGEKSKEVQHFEVEKRHSDNFGIAFRLDNRKVSKLVPKEFPEDPVINLAEKTLKKIQQHFYALQHTISLFGQDHIVGYQERMAGLIQIKEMLEGMTTREICQINFPPTAKDYMGRGRNTYVFVENGSENSKSELWHVDRSHDLPVLTQLSLDSFQAEKIQFMFQGAQSGLRPQLGIHNITECNKWYALGENAQKMKNNTVLRLNPNDARQIPELVLKDIEMYKYLLTDRAYYETSNELTDVLENTKQTPENARLIQRCRDIHSHLYVIEQDRLHAFPKSRGVVPPHLRQKMMQMMTALVLDKHSPEARYYFLTEHPIYQGDFQEDHLDDYEPGSFLWDGQESLYYLDENKKKIEVTMTDSIRRKLTKITTQSERPHVILANDVYELMTRPRLFYYYCGFPIGLDLRWLDFSSIIPLQFDRSQGLHTGTAQEMTRVIHEQKLSVMQLLYKLGEVIVLLVVPLILAHFGIDIPWDMLGDLAATIIGWVLLIWNIEYTFNYLRFSLTMNDLAQPELNQLDKMLQELNNDLKNLPSLEYLNADKEETEHSEKDRLLPDFKLP